MQPFEPEAKSTITCNGQSTAGLSIAGLGIDDYTDVIRQVLATGYYTNHGPLAREFESRLEAYLSVQHVVTAGNEALALLIAMAGLQLRGAVVLPAIGGIPAVNACNWLGLRPVICDVDPATYQPTEEHIGAVLNEDVSAVCVVETWGRRCDAALLEWLDQRGLAAIVIGDESFGSPMAPQSEIHYPRAARVLDFGPERTLTTLQGGAIAVADDELAERCRNIRSSYGARKAIPVRATCNGRFSEIQAAIGLKSLDRLAERLSARQQLASQYLQGLLGVGGIEIYDPGSLATRQPEQFPIAVTSKYPLSRRELFEHLVAAGHDVREGKPALSNLPTANQIASALLLLPMDLEGSPDALIDSIVRLAAAH